MTDDMRHLDNTPQGCDRRWRTRRVWLAHGRHVNDPQSSRCGARIGDRA